MNGSNFDVWNKGQDDDDDGYDGEEENTWEHETWDRERNVQWRHGHLDQTKSHRL